MAHTVLAPFRPLKNRLVPFEISSGPFWILTLVPFECMLRAGGSAMPRVLLAIMLASCLSACATGPTPAQIAAADDASCQSYGASPGSDAYYQCRMAKDQQRQQARAALAAAILSRPAPQPYYLPPPAPVVAAPRPLNCTSMPVGSMVSTQCY